MSSPRPIGRVHLLQGHKTVPICPVSDTATKKARTLYSRILLNVQANTHHVVVPSIWTTVVRTCVSKRLGKFTSRTYFSENFENGRYNKVEKEYTRRTIYSYLFSYVYEMFSLSFLNWIYRKIQLILS